LAQQAQQVRLAVTVPQVHKAPLELRALPVFLAQPEPALLASLEQPEQLAWEPLGPPELRAAMELRVQPGQRVPQASAEQQVLAALQGQPELTVQAVQLVQLELVQQEPLVLQVLMALLEQLALKVQPALSASALVLLEQPVLRAQALLVLRALGPLSPLVLMLQMYYLLVQLPPERSRLMMLLPTRSSSGTTAKINLPTWRWEMA
jgi:hypothetical protein